MSARVLSRRVTVEVDEVEPMLTGGLIRRRISPAEVVITDQRPSGGDVHAEVSGFILDREGNRTARVAGVQFDGPVRRWPRWLRDLVAQVTS